MSPQQRFKFGSFGVSGCTVEIAPITLFPIETAMLKDNRSATRSDVVLVARVRRSTGVSGPSDTVGNEIEYGIAIHDASHDGLSFLTDQAFRPGTVLEMRVLCDGR